MQPEDGVMFRSNSLRRILPVALPLISLVFGLLVPTVFFAQTRKPDEQKQGMGVSTGVALSYTSRRTVNITDLALGYQDMLVRARKRTTILR